MIKKIIAGILWTAAGLICFSAASFSAKKARIRDDGGMSADAYVFGGKHNPKAVLITNQTPAKLTENVIKSKILGK